MEVRRLWLGELPDVIELVVALMAEEKWPVTEDTRGAIALSLIPEESAPTFVAVADEQPVGVIQVKWADDPATGRRLDVFRLYVRPEFRSQGVGHALIGAVIDWLPPEIEVDIYISTVGPLRHSFKRMGFETISQIHAAPLARVRAAVGRH